MCSCRSLILLDRWAGHGRSTRPRRLSGERRASHICAAARRILGHQAVRAAAVGDHGYIFRDFVQLFLRSFIGRELAWGKWALANSSAGRTSRPSSSPPCSTMDANATFNSTKRSSTSVRRFTQRSATLVLARRYRKLRQTQLLHVGDRELDADFKLCREHFDGLLPPADQLD
jgi:hypothetical protein